MSTKGSIYCVFTGHKTTSDCDHYHHEVHIYHECFDDGPINPIYIERRLSTHGRTSNTTERLSWREAVAVYKAVAADVEACRRAACKSDEQILAESTGKWAPSVEDATEHRSRCAAYLALVEAYLSGKTDGFETLEEEVKT